MTKSLFTMLLSLFAAWFYACPTSAQDVALPGFRQIVELRHDDARCPEGNRCFLAGPGATALQMLSRVNRGVADATRRVTMTDLEAANPCDVSYVREDGSSKRNGLCPVMNGTTERVTWESFCDGHHACQRWIIASYPGHLRQYNVPTRHRLTPGERIEEMTPVQELARAPDVPQAVVTAPIPLVATPSPDLSLQRRIALLTQELKDARRASGVDWTLSGSMVGIMLVLLLVAFYLGSTRAKVTTVNLSEDENGAWRDKLQTMELKLQTAEEIIRGLRPQIAQAEAKALDAAALADDYEKPLTAMRALYQTKMSAELTPQRLDETIKGYKAHGVLEAALGGLSVGAVKQAVVDAGLFRSLKAAWKENFPDLGFNQLAIAGVPVKHKQEIEALCTTHNAEIEDLRRNASPPVNGQNDDGIERLLNMLSADVWKPLCALTGDFRSLLTTDKNGVCTLNPTVDPEKVKIRFGKIQNGGKNDKSEKKLQQLSVFLNSAYAQSVQIRETVNGIINNPSGLPSIFDDRSDEPTSEILLKRDESGANALPADPTRVTDASKPEEPKT